MNNLKTVKMGKMRNLAEVMKRKDWFTNKETSELIDKAVSEGFVLRPSVSQCEWTLKGVAFYRAETKGLNYISIGINNSGEIVESLNNVPVLKVSHSKIVLDNEDLDYLYFGSDDTYTYGIDTSKELKSFERNFCLQIEIAGYFSDPKSGSKIIKEKLRKIINEKIKVHKTTSETKMDRLLNLKKVIDEK